MIHELDGTKLSLCAEPLPFMEDQRDEIDRYWNHLREKNDRLWNGDFYMFSEAKIQNRVLIARGHKTDFATFLYWREHGYDKSITHISGTAFPYFADGSVLTVKMAEHTANPGRVYFPAGAFDSEDISGGSFDALVNIRRELKEEVNLDVQAEWNSGSLLVFESSFAFFICQRMQLPFDFKEIERDWKLHRANGGDDEIDGLVHICHRDDIPLEMPAYAAALCHHHFDSWERRQVEDGEEARLRNL